MNALAHMSLGMGTLLGPEEALMCDHADKDSVSHPYISAYPYIVLKGRPNKIREAVEVAKAQGIQAVNFVDTMTIGSYIEQLARTKETSNQDLKFYGAVFYGEIEVVSALTKKFSLL
ncbi:MAG: DUF2000 domain-containing protein [Alphaproteobacteria bacterium]|nr:DUF2000 domain-containing protein [Alphaproteobacteria bacterium]